MPVQINEVIIRTVVDSTPVNNANQSTSVKNSPVATYDAVEKVLEIIKEKKER